MSDAGLVARLTAWDGPGVVAIMPEGAVEFVHDPSAAAAPGGRLTITSQPAATGLRRVGPFTVTQQRDELQQLSELASTRREPVAAAAPAPPEGKDDPVGKLAAWLLTQAESGTGAQQG